MTEATNFARVSEAMHLLGQYLAPFVERELKRTGAGWWTNLVLPNVSDLARRKLPARPKQGTSDNLTGLDVADLLSLLAKNFRVAFLGTLPPEARNYVEELRSTRNQWAHKPAGADLEKQRADRAIQTAALLLEGVDRSAAATVRAMLAQGAAEAVAANGESSGTSTAPKSEPPVTAGPGPEASFSDAGLRAWREVAVPRQDVRTGVLTQGQFAADLHEVFRQNPEVGREYLDAREFFERTYVTAGLRDFLKTALRRLTGQGGDAVVQLKTGFGGGKTHTMLALYHMARSGAAIVNDVPVLKELSQELGVAIPRANTAVLVGTKISATSAFDDDPELKALGLSLRTLWGHMAWQLGGYQAYRHVQDADIHGVAPAEEIRKVLQQCAPCIILIDELVAYGRNLPPKRTGLPGGSLESLLTFLHSLTEIAKATPGVVVAASIPESDMEIGGVQGERVLARVQQTFGRLETAWQPVQPTESFEVVRRRLFERVDPEGRDQTVSRFVEYYRQNRADFPAEVTERTYEERMQAAYPFHPELFDRLYQDWNSAVPQFQSTRGVLRLLAGAVQAMWQEGDQSALIMPATLRFDLPVVREELMRYLPPQFQSVIDGDIEGPSAEAVRIDASNARYGRVGAARATARTILLGSVPGKATPGIEDVRIRLGAARPGEPIATYNDVLGRLRERLQFLHGSGSRYWFEVRPNLNRTVADRMSRISEREVYELLETRLRGDREHEPFAGKHVAPASSADVPDDVAVRLVVLSPQHPHRAGDEDSPALAAARDLLNQRGNAPRLNRNMLVFAALDEEMLPGLHEQGKLHLAWKSIVDERRQLNLDEDQMRQATDLRDRSEKAIDGLLSDGYRWFLVPYQGVREKNGELILETETIRAIHTSGRLGSAGPIAQRAAATLESEELLLLRWSPHFLSEVLDRWFWRRGLEHIEARRLWEENLTRYLYLPRLADAEVLKRAIQEGATATEFFGYAQGHEGGTYSGLSFGQRPQSVLLDRGAVVVRRDVAEAALKADARSGPVARGPAEPSSGSNGDARSRPPSGPSATLRRRFYGRVRLNELKLGSSAGQIGEEIVQHLSGLLDGEVEVELEIRARSASGFPEQVVRTVSENARTLKFEHFEFEE